MQQLKERVIYIKPDNDPISSIGDLVPNYQLIQCPEWPAVLHNCHDFWRMLCKYTYACGTSADRAGAFYNCAEKWGYPEPIPTENRTFGQVCSAELDTMKDALGDVFSVKVDDLH